MRNKDKPKVNIEVELTEGYQQRFTQAILNIYEKRKKREEQNENMLLPKLGA